MAPSSTLTVKRGTDSPGMVMHAPERRSNSQPWSGHVTISPSTRPSQRLPPLCAHSLPMAKISSPRRKRATSKPFTTTNSTAPAGRDARAKAFARGICSPSPSPLPLRGGGIHIPSPLGGGGRVRGDVRRVAIGLVEQFSDVQYLDGRSRGFEALD